MPRRWQLMLFWMIIRLISPMLASYCSCNWLKNNQWLPMQFCHLSDSWKVLLPIDFYESFGFGIKNLCFHCTKRYSLTLLGRLRQSLSYFCLPTEKIWICDLSRNVVPSRTMLLLTLEEQGNFPPYHLYFACEPISVKIHAPPRKKYHPVNCYLYKKKPSPPKKQKRPPFFDSSSLRYPLKV